MGVQSYTIRDVAKLACVSTATVSRVINGMSSVSSSKRAMVLTAISELQYRPNASAAELGRGGGGIPRRSMFRRQP
jgi:LacI family transcriptional regulator